MERTRRPIVRPRAFTKASHESFLLEDLINESCERGSKFVFEIVGPPASGKTTALSYLAELPFDTELTFIDDATAEQVSQALWVQSVVYTTSARYQPPEQSCSLAPWCRDDLIEYLLESYPEKCGPILEKITNSLDAASLFRWPVGLTHLIDLLAKETSGSVRDLFLDSLKSHSQPASRFDSLCQAAAQLQRKLTDSGKKLVRHLRSLDESRDTLQLLQIPLIREILVADQWIKELLGTEVVPSRELPLHEGTVIELARRTNGNKKVRELLELNWFHGDRHAMPITATILTRVDPCWQPTNFRPANLFRADLSGVNWRAIELPQADLCFANLTGANLMDADLSAASCRHANFQRAEAQRAFLGEAIASHSSFDSADLSHADLSGASLHQASFQDANLSSVFAPHCSFEHADLTGASLREAQLYRAGLSNAVLTRTDLRGADATSADLSHTDLRSTQFSFANLERAKLKSVDMEFVEWRRVKFSLANLNGSLLTGSRLIEANFRYARLMNTGLAEIDWENADLRWANLSGSTFHLGSSRSGKVDSPYPSHGTRTGFYTNDFEDRSYKAPEYIRKANLCGADLRGAKIHDVDFYLVDLRGAKYDRDQERHLRSCDAILED